MHTINIGLIGAGRIGRIHAEVLAHRVPDANLMAVTDALPANAERCAADFQIRTVAATAAELFADPALHAVAICSSTDTHAQFMIEAAAAGKHIFCEKPIALDLHAIDSALAAVQEAGVKLQVGFNRRFHASFAQVRELVASGKIGQPHLVRISSRDSTPPPVSYVKVSGGMLLDMTIHDFDMARYLIGSEGVNGTHWARPDDQRPQNLGFGHLCTAVVERLRKGERFDVWEGDINMVATPSLASESAEMLLRIVEQDAQGVFHCCGGEPIGRRELALLTAEVFALDQQRIQPGSPGWGDVAGIGIPYDTSVSAAATAEQLEYQLPSVRQLLQLYKHQVDTGTL